MESFVSTLALPCVDFAFAAVAWLILLCTYPDFARWSPVDFAQHHAVYCQRVGFVVGPLLCLQLGGHLWTAWAGGDWLGLGLASGGWALTGLWSVPAHRRLQQEGPQSTALASLIHSHRWRTALWSGLALSTILRATG